MDTILERMMTPAVLAMLIPLCAVLVWGISSCIRAMKGTPDDFEDWQAEIDELKKRVDMLERAQKELQRVS